MKLKRVEFKNFKLLDGVVISFSADPQKPLTVIRAENGSGKTSLLWGLAWAFYGDAGLPSKKARLTSTHRTIGIPTTVQVVVDFEHDPDGLGEVRQYVLTRTVEETPGMGDDFSHGPMSTKLIVRKPAGDEIVPGNPDAVLEQFIPQRLKDVFLTDGDKVQRFISGTVATKERQHNVHQAIRALLGLDRLGEVEKDLIAVEKQFRKEMAESGGQDVQDAQAKLDACETQLAKARDDRDKLTDRRAKIETDIEAIEKDLASIKGHGDLGTIQADLAQAKKDLDQAHRDELEVLERIRTLFKSSEELSWALAGEPLQLGQKVLSDLAERGVIPGSSTGVLQDRLDMKLCICGESLEEGTDHRAHVLELLDSQKHVSEERARLTATFHRTRAGLDRFTAALEDGEDFWAQRPKLLQSHAAILDRTKDAQQRVSAAEAKRDAIDEEKIARLTERLHLAKKDLTETSEDIGELDGLSRRLDEERLLLANRYDKAQKAAKSDAKTRHRHDIAEDLMNLVSTTLAILKTEHVQAVSDRMNAIFMDIVGGSPELKGAVFQGVRLTDSFDIVVDAANKKTLDTDYEVNGASQRALTLAFIWALMEVSATVAPRVIDTPLGMTAGGVKQRMVQAITEPVPGDDGLDYQVVLLLTRSDIRDIEALLDERAGRYVTLSCSKDFPTDLVNDWDVAEPTIRHCACTHRQFCDVCGRRNDSQYGLSRRI